jgi:clan AA aspartic protease (TIGR02281 family)
MLTPSDARAAGIDPSALVYDKSMRTANGTIPAATAVLREVRVGGLSIGDVRAAIIPKAPQSVLGISFLSRLKSFEMRQDRLTLSW